MAPPLKTFDPELVSVTFAAIPIRGYADGEFIRVTPITTMFESVAGVDAETLRIKQGTRGIRTTITLLQSSDSNLALSAVLNSDINSTNGAGVGIFSVVDLSGTTIITAAESWIVGWPEVAYDKTATNREWVIESHNPVMNVGGN